MAFRHKSAHDRWLAYTAKQEAFIRATGLPTALFRRDDIFEDFLEKGVFLDEDGKQTVITHLPDAAFLALEKVVNGAFDFQSSYPAFYEERFRRFHRYG